VDGMLLVGSGIGTRTRTGSGPSDITAGAPSPLTALCVPGTPTCNICGNAAVDPAEQCDDGNTAAGDGCSARCTTEYFQPFSGVAAGGHISFIVNGVYLRIDTSAGDSAFDVAAAAAAAINDHPLLDASGVTAALEGRAFRTEGVLTAVRSSDPGIVAGTQPVACPAEAPMYVEAGIVSDSPIYDVELRRHGGDQVAYVSMRGVTAGVELRELDAHDPADNSAHFGFCAPQAGLLDLYLDGILRGEAKLQGPAPDSKVLSYSTQQTTVPVGGRDIIHYGLPLQPRAGLSFIYGGLFQLMDQATDDYAVQVPGTFELVGSGVYREDENRHCRPIGGSTSPVYPVPLDLVVYREALSGRQLTTVAGHADQDPDEVNAMCAYKSRRALPPE